MKTVKYDIEELADLLRRGSKDRETIVHWAEDIKEPIVFPDPAIVVPRLPAVIAVQQLLLTGKTWPMTIEMPTCIPRNLLGGVVHLQVRWPEWEKHSLLRVGVPQPLTMDLWLPKPHVTIINEVLVRDSGERNWQVQNLPFWYANSDGSGLVAIMAQNLPEVERDHNTVLAFLKTVDPHIVAFHNLLANDHNEEWSCDLVFDNGEVGYIEGKALQVIHFTGGSYYDLTAKREAARELENHPGFDLESWLVPRED